MLDAMHTQVIIFTVHGMLLVGTQQRSRTLNCGEESAVVLRLHQ